MLPFAILGFLMKPLQLKGAFHIDPIYIFFCYELFLHFCHARDLWMQALLPLDQKRDWLLRRQLLLKIKVLWKSIYKDIFNYLGIAILFDICFSVQFLSYGKGAETLSDEFTNKNSRTFRYNILHLAFIVLSLYGLIGFLRRRSRAIHQITRVLRDFKLLLLEKVYVVNVLGMELYITSVKLDFQVRRL